jgi:NH3-dependent NAD+ synthetase
MKIDIVERLREHRMTTDWQVAVSEAHEAADEIERLRGELADAETDAVHDRQQIRENAASITALQAENTKLRAALDRLYWYAERLEGVVYGQGNEGEIEVMKEARAALTAQPAAPGGE